MNQNQKSHMLSFRVSSETMQRLRTAAEKEDRTVSDTARRMIEDRLKKQK